MLGPATFGEPLLVGWLGDRRLFGASMDQWVALLPDEWPFRLGLKPGLTWWSGRSDNSRNSSKTRRFGVEA